MFKIIDKLINVHYTLIGTCVSNAIMLLTTMTTRIPYPTSVQGTRLILLAFTLIDLTFFNSFVFAAQYDWIHNHWTVQPGKAEKSDLEK